jgi:UDP-glucose 4-epimerase
VHTNGRALKILVTGGAGFIGSHIVDAYIKAGHEVTVIDNLSNGKKGNLNSRAEFLPFDIRNRRQIERAFKKGRFDVVNHHAAQIDVRKSVADPVHDAQINILGLLNILEECRAKKVKKIVFASSGGTIYGECDKRRPASEGAEARPLSPYGIAKLASEFYIKTYGAMHGLRFCILRYANVYGPRQDPFGEAGVVAIFSCRILNNKPVTIFGDGRQSRDFVCVKDVAAANLSALSKNVKAGLFNIGTGLSTNVNELFSLMAKSVSYDKDPSHKPIREGELMTSVLNISKARRLLGWTPETPLKKGLLQTVEFFRNISMEKAKA